MKDRGSLIQLLDAFGIEWTDGTHPEGYSFITRKNEDGSSSVILGGGDGYTDFEVAFEFDENGSFTGWWVHD